MSTKTKSITKFKEKIVDESSIILYNDDYNTFDYVIKCLIKICKHTSEQAEQCAYIVHFKGKCSVKTGLKDRLLPVCKALKNKGLSAKIE